MRFLWDAPWREGKEEGGEAKLKKEQWSRMGHAGCSMASGLAWAGNPSPEETKMANDDANREVNSNLNSRNHIHT